MSEPIADVPKKSSRRFTKLVMISSLVLVWALMFASVFTGQAAHVVPSGFALIGGLFSVYTGVGHLDFRKAVQLTLERFTDTARSETDDQQG